MSEELDTRRSRGGFPGELGHAKEQVLWNSPFHPFPCHPIKPEVGGGQVDSPPGLKAGSCLPRDRPASQALQGSRA